MSSLASQPMSNTVHKDGNIKIEQFEDNEGALILRERSIQQNVKCASKHRTKKDLILKILNNDMLLCILDQCTVGDATLLGLTCKTMFGAYKKKFPEPLPMYQLEASPLVGHPSPMLFSQLLAPWIGPLYRLSASMVNGERISVVDGSIKSYKIQSPWERNCSSVTLSTTTSSSAKEESNQQMNRGHWRFLNKNIYGSSHTDNRAEERLQRRYIDYELSKYFPEVSGVTSQEPMYLLPNPYNLGKEWDAKAVEAIENDKDRHEEFESWRDFWQQTSIWQYSLAEYYG